MHAHAGGAQPSRCLAVAGAVRGVVPDGVATVALAPRVLVQHGRVATASPAPSAGRRHGGAATGLTDVEIAKLVASPRVVVAKVAALRASIAATRARQVKATTSLRSGSLTPQPLQPLDALRHAIQVVLAVAVLLVRRRLGRAVVVDNLIGGA